jgi:hypothetical protein
MRTRTTLAILGVVVVMSPVPLLAAPTGVVGSDSCAAPPYGLSSEAYTYLQSITIDASKVTPTVQAVCRMKARKESRAPLYRVGMDDALIDRVNAVSLMLQWIGGERALEHAVSSRSRAQPSTAPIGPAMRQFEETLQSAVYQLKYNGNMSEELLTLQRFGVFYLDASGNLLPVENIARRAAKVVNGGGQRPEGERRQVAIAMGMPRDLATVVAGGEEVLDAALKPIRKN